MQQRPEEILSATPRHVGLSVVVDVYDRHELFEIIDNQRVVQLSRLKGEPGFSGVDNVRKSTGISVRRILRDGVTAVDLAEALCRRLEQSTGHGLNEFDAVLLCHSHTDSSACRRLARQLCRRMRLPAGSVTAHNYGCCGFLKLLQEGTEQLDEMAEGTRIALLSVETPETWHDASDRLFCGLVSAGATAAVLENGAGLPLSIVRADDFLIPAVRRPNSDPLFSIDTTDVFDFRGADCHRAVMRMNSEPVFLNGIELMLDNLRTAMLSIDRQPGQRVVVAPHQPSGKLLRALVAAARAEFPDVEFLNNLDQYGNTISSSVPTVLSRLPEVLRANNRSPLNDGDHLILLAAGICMDEISNHMSTGHACLQWVNAPQERSFFDLVNPAPVAVLQPQA